MHSIIEYIPSFGHGKDKLKGLIKFSDYFQKINIKNNNSIELRLSGYLHF